MTLLALLFAFHLAPSGELAADSARIANDRLVIEPLGASFEIPQTWLAPAPAHSYVPKACGTHPLLCARIHLSPESIAELQNAVGEWDREYSKVIDSVLPFGRTVAQLGGEGWGAGASSFGDLQVRVYVSDLPLDSIAVRVRTTGVRTANKAFPTSAAQESDTLGWHTQRIQWDAWYYDYGGTARVEFFSRRIGSRTLTLVFMYAEGIDKPISDRAMILESFRESPIKTPEAAVVTPECYSLRYSDPLGSASAGLFPVWVMLLPGSAAGSAVGGHHPQISDLNWDGLLKYSGWKRMPSDSLEIMFTGSYEGISIHAARTGTKLGGRATWLTDLIGLPESSMVLAGDRVQCMQNAAPGRS